MDSLKETIRNKRRPPPPPKKDVKVNTKSTLVAAMSKKRGLGWPWDQPSSHFQLFFPSYQQDEAPSTESESECKISWVFNWELWVPADLPKTIEWVPCVRTAGQVGDILPFLSDIRSKGRVVTHLLGFNEPEIASQANLPVSEAVRLWKEYILPARTQLSLRLGSPGMCSDTSLSIPWLNKFFASFSTQEVGSEEARIREGITVSGVEFMVLHWYGLSNTDMIAFLETMHGRYRLPVWLNEFACSRMGSDDSESTDTEITAFLHEAIPWLERTSWVKRYSFFGLGQGQDVGTWVGRQNNFTKIQHNQSETGGFNLSNIGRLYVGL